MKCPVFPPLDLASCRAGLNSFYAFHFEKKRPDLVEKMVVIDCGGDLQPSLLEWVLILSYHILLICGFVLGRPFGDWIALAIAKLFGAPTASGQIRACTCYPYFQYWAEALARKAKEVYVMPTAPVLFVYGGAGCKKYSVSPRCSAQGKCDVSTADL